MKNQMWLITIIIVIIVGAGTFFGGMKYQQSKGLSKQNFRGPSQLGNRASGMPQRSGAPMIRGEILSRDEQGITVKLPDESTKIIVLQESTTISKAAAGSKDDLAVGETVTIFGQENSDGSVSASQIQLNPTAPNPESR